MLGLWDRVRRRMTDEKGGRASDAPPPKSATDYPKSSPPGVTPAHLGCLFLWARDLE